MVLKCYHVIILCIFSVNGWIFNAITMHFNEIYLLYQKTLKCHHHAENYKESLVQDITPFGLHIVLYLQTISPDFNILIIME